MLFQLLLVAGTSLTVPLELVAGIKRPSVEIIASNIRKTGLLMFVILASERFN